MLQLQLLAIFGAGIAVASWVWCGATLHAWSRYIRRKFHCELEEPMKFQKHKIIAQAFDQRKKFNEGRKISIECQYHTDPVGLHFDLNSAASNELSTTWAANLPRLVNRRGAVPKIITGSVSSNSEMSYSLQTISIESRRNSGESQLSVQFAELKARKINSRRRGHRIKRRRDFGRSSRNGNPKRDSSISLDSHLGNQIVNVMNSSRKDVPNLNKRRTAIAGLDDESISRLFNNAKLIFPYNSKASRSDDENVSVTISESKYNVVMNNKSCNNLDLSDQLIMQSLRQGIQIEELDSSSGSDNEHTALNAPKNNHNTHTDTESSNDDSASCPELKQLLQSSLNSTVSTGTQNRASKQSKTSIDVAVQANAKEIAIQTAAAEDVQKVAKGHKTKTKKLKKRVKKQRKLSKS